MCARVSSDYHHFSVPSQNSELHSILTATNFLRSAMLPVFSRKCSHYHFCYVAKFTLCLTWRFVHHKHAAHDCCTQIIIRIINNEDCLLPRYVAMSWPDICVTPIGCQQLMGLYVNRNNYSWTQGLITQHICKNGGPQFCNCWAFSQNQSTALDCYQITSTVCFWMIFNLNLGNQTDDWLCRGRPNS